MSITKLTIPSIKFVDGLPSEGQFSIRWIENGEQMNGADVRGGNQGQLNRSGVEIQYNVQSLIESEVKTVQKVNEVIDGLQAVNDILGEMDGQNIIEQVNSNTIRIGQIDTTLISQAQSIDQLSIRYSDLQQNVGVRASDPKDWTVRENIWYLKNQIGAWPDEDVNGDEVPGASGSGIKYRITTLTTSVSTQETELNAIKNQIIDSGLDDLGEKVTTIRAEIGASSLAVGKPVIYSRLNTLENQQQANMADAASIKTFIDFDNPISIDSRVTTNTQNITVIGTKVSGADGLENKVIAIQEDIGSASQADSIKGDLTVLDAEVEDIYTTLGRNISSGLQAKVDLLTTTVGTDNVAAPRDGTVLKRLVVLNDGLTSVTGTVQGLQQDIGGVDGLNAKVIQLSKLVETGTNPTTGTTVEEKGLIPTVKVIQTDIVNITSRIDVAENDILTINASIANLVPEAPKDGEAYVRKDGAWVKLSDFLTP
ncbi:hypothetical protein fHeYen901_184 [Yersinia phage fHe-Yen9-01]|uniref:Fibritin C-terminal domain-containing protein n=1 Tax=Yersinia phage fHe-Yen9-01 TaxID=1965363 RepID=A0A1V0DXT3_9CAUD|nr:fibritin neck whisker [Yersinia phage fHe-Yen9-01]ARB05957.1 hypothetical protein fHeYen901_184 [Yersinia phage fHe-Yen9-01]